MIVSFDYFLYSNWMNLAAAFVVKYKKILLLIIYIVQESLKSLLEDWLLQIEWNIIGALLFAIIVDCEEFYYYICTELHLRLSNLKFGGSVRHLTGGEKKNERSSFFVCLLLAFTNLADNNIDFDFIWMSWYDDLLRSASVHYAATKQVRFCLNNSQFLLRENHLPHSLLFYNDLWKSKDPNK